MKKYFQKKLTTCKRDIDRITKAIVEEVTASTVDAKKLIQMGEKLKEAQKMRDLFLSDFFEEVTIEEIIDTYNLLHIYSKERLDLFTPEEVRRFFSSSDRTVTIAEKSLLIDTFGHAARDIKIKV